MHNKRFAFLAHGLLNSFAFANHSHHFDLVLLGWGDTKQFVYSNYFLFLNKTSQLATYLLNIILNFIMLHLDSCTACPIKEY